MLALSPLGIFCLLVGAVTAVPLSADGAQIPDRQQSSVRPPPVSFERHSVARSVPLSRRSLTLPSQDSQLIVNSTIATPYNISSSDDQVGVPYWPRIYPGGYRVTISHWEGHVDKDARTNLQEYLDGGPNFLDKLMQKRGIPRHSEWFTFIADGRFIYENTTLKQAMVITQDTESFPSPTLTYGDVRIILRGFLDWYGEIKSTINVVDKALVQLYRRPESKRRRAFGYLEDIPSPAA